MIPEIHTEDQAIILKKFEKQILQLFEVFDHAGNKTIDVREIPTVLCTLGCVPTKAETEEIIKNIQEPDSRGNIHISKFLPFVSNLILKYKFHPAPAEELLRAFQILDKNNVGFLTNDFLTKIMTERGEQFSQEEMKEMTSIAANSDTGDVFYEIYINHIMVRYSFYNVCTFSTTKTLHNSSSLALNPLPI